MPWPSGSLRYSASLTKWSDSPVSATRSRAAWASQRARSAARAPAARSDTGRSPPAPAARRAARPAPAARGRRRPAQRAAAARSSTSRPTAAVEGNRAGQIRHRQVHRAEGRGGGDLGRVAGRPRLQLLGIGRCAAGRRLEIGSVLTPEAYRAAGRSQHVVARGREWSMANSRSSLVWAAETWMRMRALPCGTTG